MHCPMVGEPVQCRTILYLLQLEFSYLFLHNFSGHVLLIALGLHVPTHRMTHIYSKLWCDIRCITVSHRPTSY